MLTLAIPFPMIDPVMIELGPIVIRWYALAYISGLVLGWLYLRWLVQRPGWQLTTLDLDDLLLYVTFGVVLGGRLGYVLFYHPEFYLSHPGKILQVWQGGMSFHGGMLGVITAMALFAWRRGIAFLEIGDAVAAAVPIGLFFGRIANFINAELFGRARPTCPGRWSFPMAVRSRAIQASSMRPPSKASSCSSSSSGSRGDRGYKRMRGVLEGCF